MSINVTARRLYCSDFIAAGLWRENNCCESCHEDENEGLYELQEEECTLNGVLYTASICCCRGDRPNPLTPEHFEAALRIR
jgi:hypothetical protein